MTDNVRRGRDAESRAADYLMKKGYKIIRRNYQIRGGEIDLIAKDGDWLVFIEVQKCAQAMLSEPVRKP